jgi:hypothetical protein
LQTAERRLLLVQHGAESELSMVALTAGNKLAVLADGIFLKKNPTMRGVWSSFSAGAASRRR